MTLHLKKSFTVPASAPSKEACKDGQHPMADVKGRCLKCGKQIRAVHFATPDPEPAA